MNKRLTLKPLRSGTKQVVNPGEPYYEQIVICDGEYPVALVHVDLFYGGRDGDNSIHNHLCAGCEVEISVQMRIVEHE